MPPKPKFTEEEIVAAAYEITKNRGIEAVVAREVGKVLGTSATPIFTAFSSMEELQNAVKERAWNTFSEYVKVADEYNPAFKMRGYQMIKFAQQEQELFKLIFMNQNRSVDFMQLMQTIESDFDRDIDVIKNNYHLGIDEARHIFNHVWVYTFGICVLIVNEICSFTDNEIFAMLGEAFAGIVMIVKSDKKFTEVIPAKKDTTDGKRMEGAFPDIY